MDFVERLAQRIDLNADQPAPPNVTRLVANDGHAFPEAPEAPDSPTMISRLETMPPPNRKIAELVAVDLEALEKRGYLTPDSPHSLLAEEYRIIKRPLLRAAFNNLRPDSDRDHVALITSARPNEGKTFTSVNLGMSIASEPDFHVLLVDADMRQRGLSRVFGVTERPGLTDVIRDPEMTLADVIVKTNIPNLCVVPAGGGVASPTELLASQRARDVIDDMTRRYADRFIIIDSPPVLAASEPGVLASYVGQVIMVVMAGQTPKQAVAESFTLLEACPRVSFILNKVTVSSNPARFGYYGYYGEH